MKHVFIVGSKGIPGAYGGYETFVDQLTEYPQWIALYKDHMDYKYHFDMWQYTCTGSVPGVKGDVDINIFFPYGT